MHPNGSNQPWQTSEATNRERIRPGVNVRKVLVVLWNERNTMMSNVWAYVLDELLTSVDGDVALLPPI